MTQARVYRQELTPVHFIERAGIVHADREAVTDGDTAYTWREFRARARRLASALRAQGLRKEDRVAFVALNSEPLLLAHFAVPMAGGILVAINTRWSAEEVAYVIEHCGARWVCYTPELKSQIDKVAPGVRRVATDEAFEALVGAGEDGPVESWLENEDDSISFNYTSGTTGKPKGVVYHHRGAYLNAMAMALDHRLVADSRYLWTLPMFHCNGWTFPWSLAAVGAHSVCIPRVDPTQAWRAFDEGITHFCAAPTVLIMLANDPAAHRLSTPVRVFTAGAPPSPTLIARMTELNFELDHVYGLTETYGPCTICVPPDLSSLSPAEGAQLRARQGYANVFAGEARVVDEQLRDVPADGQTLGEVVMRGNVVMKGYFKDQASTDNAFAGGWFHSGDLAVRMQTIPSSCGTARRTSSSPVARTSVRSRSNRRLRAMPAVLECAVIAVPHEKWGEVPKAFVTLKPGVTATEGDVLEHCRARLARFKVPHAVEFGPLPKTSTGKIQKFVLREKEWQGKAKRIN